MDLVVRAAEITRDDAILEVGTGTGGLTHRLIELAGAVLSVEIDSGFHALAKRTVAGQFSHVRLVRGDILRIKN